MRKWEFPSNNNATIYGLNDAGVATFSSTLYESLVREAIQNSLDAKNEETDGPVEVHFTQEKIEKTALPGWESLKQAIAASTEVRSNDEKTKKFFSDALRQFDNEIIRVLKVSDYNTSGLEGGLTGRQGSSWSRLVKESGTSNKSGDAGGSFGIGKAAYFACSQLRTVFFSSLSTSGEQSYIGVSKLISFDLPDGTMSQGIGYYAESDKFYAIPEQACFDGSEKRVKSGTDIYIIQNFLIQDTQLSSKLIDSVISNFLISIMKGLLIVKVQDELIDSEYVDRYFEGKKTLPRESLSNETRDLLAYYLILKDSDNKTVHIQLDSNEYGKDYGFNDGDCELLIRKGDDYNRRILITRKTGMKLFEQSKISGSINFTGILYISGSSMNRFFRELEGPAHDKWVPNQQSKDYKKQEAAFKDLRNYLKAKVMMNFEDQIGDEFDAFDAGQFLPDNLDIQEDGDNGIEVTLQEKKVKVSSKKMLPSKKKRKEMVTLKDLGAEGEELSDGMDSPTGTGNESGTGVLHSGEKANSGQRGTGDGPGYGFVAGDEAGSSLNGEGQNNKESNTENIKYKESRSETRVMCINASSGRYQIVLKAPSKAKHVKLEFSIAGEQDDYVLSILNASLVASENALITETHDNIICIEDVAKNEKLRIMAEIDFREHCMMEVEYYESKR